MGKNAIDMLFTKSISLEAIENNLKQYIYGSITLAVVAAIALGAITYLLLKIFKRKPSLVD